MHHYRIFDVVLASNLELPELPPIESMSSVISFFYHSEQFVKPDQNLWLYEWRDASGELSAAYTRVPGGLLLSMPGIADFIFQPGSGSLQAYPANCDVDAVSLRHALLDRVIPMCLGHLGKQMLHASAVEIDGEAGVIAFVGDTGAGKSTLAASYLGDGARLVSDDCLMIAHDDRGCHVVPGYYGMRLHDDSAMFIFEQTGAPGSVASYTEKKRLALRPGMKESAAQRKLDLIRGLFLLGTPSTTVMLEPVVTARDVMMLVKQHFFFDVRCKEQVELQFGHLRYLLDTGVPIAKLSYPREFDALREVRSAILAYLQSSAGARESLKPVALDSQTLAHYKC